MKGIILEGVVVIGVVGKVIDKLIWCGVIVEIDYLLVCVFYDIVVYDVFFDLFWEKFFGGEK